MRPILLDMHGFASFREPTRVDFTDTDFFALIGPTGSGKSTVIDAMTFALYGSVPRWGRKGMVSLALAPTMTRGTVKLVFEVDRQRYVVARELRRAGTQVQQRAASLERLVDASGVAAPGDPTVPMAKDLVGVTDAVERLLGLSYEDFCQCVVLPQGKFADFLHAKPAERQEILLRLLGAEHYRRMMEKANQRAAEAAQRAGFIKDQLIGYADATPAAEDQARAREAALTQLAGRVETVLPRIREARQELSAADARLRQLQAEQAALCLVRVPDGTDALDASLTASREAVQRLRAAEQAAEDADAAAREGLAAGPERAPLLLVRERRAERDRQQARIPGLEAGLARLGAESRDAAALARAAEQALEVSRDQRDEASRAVSATSELVSRLEAEQGTLAAVTVPAEVAALDERHAAAASAAVDAAQILEETERAETEARAALASAVPDAPLAAACRDLDELHGVLADVVADRDAASEAHRQEAAAAVALSRAREERQARQRDLDDARRAHVVAGLRPHLAIGEACPVCEQMVGTLPAAIHAPELAAAEERLQEADRTLAAAQKLAQRRGAGVATADAALAAKLGRQSALLGSLSRALQACSLSAALPMVNAVVTTGAIDLVAAAIGEVTALARERAGFVRAAEAAADAAHAARDRSRSTKAQATQADAALADARSALRAARDPLVELGAPRLDDSRIATGWGALAHWATDQAAARIAALAKAREAATGAAARHQAAAGEFTETERSVTRLRAGETAATARGQRAAADLDQARTRVMELADLLRDAPDEAEVTERLTRRDQLEATAEATGKSLLDARRKRTAQEQVLDGRQRAESAARAALSASRDRVVALGAPPVDGLGLLAGWMALGRWAADAAVRRAEDIKVASDAVAVAEQAARELAEGLRTDLGRAGIELAIEVLGTGAAPAVARAVAEARAATARIAERRAEAASLVGQQQEAQKRQQVAGTLGNLLRSSNFPQWLVTEAVQDLVATASDTLSKLSGGQYDLAYDGGDFSVVDHADADSQRSARTLSGGETFQASLALALALSSQISALAAAGAARLDSIFLDEGFGTLDPETLDVVATTLEALAQGDRMVGVVTHVAALAERVPIRFRVARNPRSSTIIREGFVTEEVMS
jgi:exonuclease SbcC